MLLSLATTYKQAGSLAVIAVMLWLGGFGCSLCCATDVINSGCLNRHQLTARATAPAAGATSCDTGAAYNCCNSHQAQRQTALMDESIRREGAFGCLLLPHQIEAITVQVRATDSLAVQAELSAPLFILCGPARTASLLETPQPLNRGGTYLRCCVFLI